MIYFLWGENSYQALRKIGELKNAFLKKHGRDFSIEELDGNLGPISPESFYLALDQINLFSNIRLVILKNILGSDSEFLKTLKKKGDALKKSADIFIFWECDAKTGPVSNFFKKYAEKIQEVKPLSRAELDTWLIKKSQELGIKLDKDRRALMIEEAGNGAEWALENELEKIILSDQSQFFSRLTIPRKASGSSDMSQKVEIGRSSVRAASPFAYVEKMFGQRAPLALKEAFDAGIAPQQFIYALLWKIKQKNMAEAYLRGIQTESAMKRDSKNAEEILERFIFSLKA